MTGARSGPAREAFKQKVELLEIWVSRGEAPADGPRLHNIKQVQAWTDIALGVRTWTSFSIAAPSGPNADLRRRLDEVLPLYQELWEPGCGGPRKPRRGRTPSERLVARERDRLVEQNVALLARLEVLEEKLILITQQRDRALRKGQELTSELAKLVPFRVR